MIYMTPQSSPTQPLGKEWGQICTPERWGNTIQGGRKWCMDNGVFTGKFTPKSFWNKLAAMEPYRADCLFVVAPDAVGDAYTTMHLFLEWGAAIKAKGWPVALVAQDDMELFPFPKVDFDALFIGGSTEWKMSEAALHCIRRAQRLGKWTHVGRVNSQKRIAHFQLAKVDSVDGTTVCYKPSREYRVLGTQLAKRPLFTL